MTANIPQNVVPRRQRSFSNLKSRRVFNYERGSINSVTISLTVTLVAVFGLGILSFVYLGQVLGTAQQGTDIQALEERMMELKEHQRAVELEGARLRSIETIEKEVQDLNLVHNTSKVTYLNTTEERVALAP